MNCLAASVVHEYLKPAYAGSVGSVGSGLAHSLAFCTRRSFYCYYTVQDDFFDIESLAIARRFRIVVVDPTAAVQELVEDDLDTAGYIGMRTHHSTLRVIDLHDCVLAQFNDCMIVHFKHISTSSKHIMLNCDALASSLLSSSYRSSSSSSSYRSSSSPSCPRACVLFWFLLSVFFLNAAGANLVSSQHHLGSRGSRGVRECEFCLGAAPHWRLLMNDHPCQLACIAPASADL